MKLTCDTGVPPLHLVITVEGDEFSVGAFCGMLATLVDSALLIGEHVEAAHDALEHIHARLLDDARQQGVRT